MQDLTNATFSVWFDAALAGKCETLLASAGGNSSNQCKISLVSLGAVSGIYIVANKNGAGCGVMITNGIGRFKRQRLAYKWSNLVWVMSPTRQRVYVNGVEVAEIFAPANDVGFHATGFEIGLMIPHVLIDITLMARSMICEFTIEPYQRTKLDNSII